MNIELSAIDLIIADTLAAANYSVTPNDAVAFKNKLLAAFRAAEAAEAAEEEAAPVDDESPETVDDDVKPPKEKQQFIIVVSDPNKQIKTDITGWVVQVPESAPIATVLDRMHTAMYDFNASKKGRMCPVKTIGEGIESVKTKFFKARDIKIKTKIPVFVVTTDNVLPKA
jgi:hypothetical protein